MKEKSKFFDRKKSEPANAGKKVFKQPKPELQTTTLWDFPSQHYGDSLQGDGDYAGVTPSYIIWNLLQRYTKPGDKVLDPMCGSGTTLDVCKDTGRIGLGFDLQSKRSDIKIADARNLPLDDNSVDFIFMDPPYSDHIKYSGDKRCLGELDARAGGYYEAIEDVIASLYKKLRNEGYMAVYIQDSFAKGKEFLPLGFEVFLRLSAVMDPVDIISVVRHHSSMKRNHWHTSAIEGNYYLRGFNYLFIFRKNARRDDKLLRHEKSGSLSKYFRQTADNQPGEVITPEKLARIIKDDEKNQKAPRQIHSEQNKNQQQQKRPSFEKQRTKNFKPTRSPRK